jgi:CRISPR/Cas system-associated endonuclease Cas3-HD
MLQLSGASNGINKNFETVQEVLKDFVTFHEYGKKPAAGKVCIPLLQRCQ